MRQTPNAKQEPVNIVGGSTFGRYRKISSEKTYNMFISDEWLVSTAGYQRVYNLLPSGKSRSIYTSIRGGFLIVVIDAIVYRLNTSLQPTKIGTLESSSGFIFIDENLSSQICIVDGVNAYIYNYSLLYPNLTKQTGLGNLNPAYVEYHNTYFLFGNADKTSNGSAWYAYQYSTPTTITQATPGQFAIQTKPDYALAVVRLPGQGNNVLAMGNTVCEVWTQIGGLQNYRRNQTINVDYGCTSISTIASSDNYVAWLAINENNAPTIMVYTGQGFKPISTDGIDHQLSHIQYVDESTAMFYRQDGHLFYQLTFYNPADNLTILYDFNTEMFFNLSDYALNYHPAKNYAYFNSKIYFVSLNNAAIYLASTDLTTYNENLPAAVSDPTQIYEIQRIRICDTIRADDSSQFRPNTFMFTIEQGNDKNVTGLSLTNPAQDLLITEDLFTPPDDTIYTEGGQQMADEDSDPIAEVTPPYQPRVDLTVSRDSGFTWSNTVSRNLNPIGIRQNILNWENLGSCNSLTLKLRFWGLSRFCVNNGFVELY
jgi:hypothetical protein